MMKHAALWTLATFVFSMAAISCQEPKPTAGTVVKPKPTAAATPAATPKPTAAPTAAAVLAAGAWAEAFKADFSGSKLDPKWVVVEGDVAVKNGAMVITAENAGEVILKNVFDAPSIRVEIVATAKGDAVSDLSPILNSTTVGYNDGYLIQVGGKGNTQNRIIKEGDEIEATASDKGLAPDKGLPLKAGTKYTIVAENDKGQIKVTLNGQTVLEYKDAKPLSGAKNGCVGLYTWGDETTVEKFVVYTKK